MLKFFTELDDTDLTSAFKVWTNHSDKVLSQLCRKLFDRRLNKNLIQDKPFDFNRINDLKQKTSKHFKIELEETDYFVISDRIENSAYKQGTDKIFY